MSSKNTLQPIRYNCDITGVFLCVFMVSVIVMHEMQVFIVWIACHAMGGGGGESCLL